MEEALEFSLTDTDANLMSACNHACLESQHQGGATLKGGLQGPLGLHSKILSLRANTEQTKAQRNGCTNFRADKGS